MDDGSLVARGGAGRERELAVAVAVTVHGHVRYKQSTTRHDGSRAHLEEGGKVPYRFMTGQPEAHIYRF